MALSFSGIRSQKLNRYPTIIFAIRWSVDPVMPTPNPKLSSHCGARFKSIAGKIWCSCFDNGSNPVTGPTEPLQQFETRSDFAGQVVAEFCIGRKNDTLMHTLAVE